MHPYRMQAAWLQLMQTSSTYPDVTAVRCDVFFTSQLAACFSMHRSHLPTYAGVFRIAQFETHSSRFAG
jgi:hypothetical protein